MEDEVLYKNKNWLYEHYINQKLPSTKIAEICNCSDSTIRTWIKKFNIKMRTKSEAFSGALHPFFGKKRPDISKRFSGKNNPMYGKEASKETRKKISIKSKNRKHSAETIDKIRAKLKNIKKSDAHKKKISKAAKKRFTNKENHPMYGKKNSWGTHTLEAKSKISKRMAGKNNPMYGKNGAQNPMWNLKNKAHPAWKPPKKRKSDLSNQIRNCEKGIEWRNKVYSRDKYTCVLCKNNKGGNLNADHIVPLSVLLKEHKVLTLSDAIKCKDLWDVSNGRTLCVKCHKLTPSYAKHLKKFESIYWNIK